MFEKMVLSRKNNNDIIQFYQGVNNYFAKLIVVCCVNQMKTCKINAKTI